MRTVEELRSLSVVLGEQAELYRVEACERNHGRRHREAKFRYETSVVLSELCEQVARLREFVGESKEEEGFLTVFARAFAASQASSPVIRVKPRLLRASKDFPDGFYAMRSQQSPGWGCVTEGKWVREHVSESQYCEFYGPLDLPG